MTVERWKDRSDVADLPRSGRPQIYGTDERLRVVGFYCQNSPIWAGRWTLRTAEKYLAIKSKKEDEVEGKQPINQEDKVCPISKSTIARILAEQELKPHKSKYFLNITDPDFFPKMESLIELFQNPPKLLYAFDECPGIQILQRLAPDLQTEETKTRLEEFEYIRNGTLDLFVCLDVNNGKMNCEIHSNHRTDTLISYMGNIFKTLPETFSKSEQAHFVLDNLNTHCTYAVCQLVAQYCGITCPSEKELDKMEKRRVWLQSKDKAIVFHYTPFHGSWLNPAEVGIGIISAKCFCESYSSADELHDSIMNYVSFRNENMACRFNWKYTGEGLHEKTVNRLIQQMKNSKIIKTDLRILTKWFQLVSNLLCNYKEKISDRTWKLYKEGFLSKEKEFQEKIDAEEGPIRKTKAQSAINELKEKIFSKLPQINLT